VHLQTQLAALRAAGIEPVVYDVDAKGRVAPDALGVLSHFDAVVWYSGNDLIARDPDQGPGTASKLAHDEILAIRDYINEGGRVFASGQNLPYAHFLGYPYPPGPTAPVPLTNDVFQYYFGAYKYQPGADTDRFAGLVAEPLGSLIGFDPFTPDTLGETANPSQLLHTSSFLPRETYPDFASTSFARYVFTGPPRENPIEGASQAFASYEDEAWKRLTRTIEVPAGTTTLDLQANWETEAGYDFGIVEVHTVGQDNWTTLPEAGGHTTQDLASCEIAWNGIHPFVDRYQTLDAAAGTCTPTGTTGAWHGLTGDSGGWTALSYDLSAYAGQTIELSISYVTDFAAEGNGVQVDDLRLVSGGAAQPLTGFEADLGGFAPADPPEGSGTIREPWARVGVIDFPGEESAGVLTRDTVLLPFGLEQVPEAQRHDIVGDAMAWLLRPGDEAPPAS
jgi:hypothetical protein